MGLFRVFANLVCLESLWPIDFSILLYISKMSSGEYNFFKKCFTLITLCIERHSSDYCIMIKNSFPGAVRMICSAGKSPCHQAWWSEFDPQAHMVEGKERTDFYILCLISTCDLLCMYFLVSVGVYGQTHTINKWIYKQNALMNLCSERTSYVLENNSNKCLLSLLCSNLQRKLRQKSRSKIVKTWFGSESIVKSTDNKCRESGRNH